MIMMENFSKWLKGNSKSELTVGTYVGDIKAFRQDIAFMDDKITEDRIRLYLEELAIKHNRTVETINKKLASIRAYCEFLVEKKILSYNPALQVKSRKKRGKKIPKTISKKNIERLLKVIDNPRDKAMIIVIWLTGVRRFELVKIRVDDVDFEEEELYVLGKNESERYIPLLPEVKEALDYLVGHAEGGWLFPSREGGHLSTRRVNEIVQGYKEKAGLGKINITPHKFRHTFLTMLFEAKANLLSIQSIAGHANLNTTKIYTEVSKQRNKAELSKLKI